MPAVPIIGAVAGVAGAVGGAISSGDKADEAKANAEAAKAPQHTTTENIVYHTPVEAGAAAVQGYGLADEWGKMMAMAQSAGAEQGYLGGMGSDAVGGGQSSLSSVDNYQKAGTDRSAEYSAFGVQRDMKLANDVKVKYLGIDNGTNSEQSNGVPMSFDDFVNMKRTKDPQKMMNDGKSLSDPLSDDEVVAAGAAMGFDAPTSKLINKIATNPQLSGDSIAAMMQDPETAGAVVNLQKKGVLDTKYNQNAGEVQRIIQQATPVIMDSRTKTPMTPEQEKAYRDEYNGLAGKTTDPKNIKQEHIGDGLIRTTVMNPDGSTAVQFIDGLITLPNGQQIKASVIGSDNEDWAKLQAKADATKPLFDQAASAQAAATSAAAAAKPDPTAADPTKDPAAANDPSSSGVNAKKKAKAPPSPDMANLSTDPTDPNYDPTMDPSAGGAQANGPDSYAPPGSDQGGGGSDPTDQSDPNYDPMLDPTNPDGDVYDPTMDPNSDQYDAAAQDNPNDPNYPSYDESQGYQYDPNKQNQDSYDPSAGVFSPNDNQAGGEYNSDDSNMDSFLNDTLNGNDQGNNAPDPAEMSMDELMSTLKSAQKDYKKRGVNFTFKNMTPDLKDILKEIMARSSDASQQQAG